MDSPMKPPGAPGVGSDKSSLKLTPQQFGKVLDALRVASASGGSDKRRFNRMAVEANLPLASLVNGQVGRCYNALTRDISINGVGLLQFAPLSPGETFLASLPAGKEELLIKCRTTFCRRLAEGIFGIGAEFSSAADSMLAAQRSTVQNGAVDPSKPADPA